MGRKTKVALTVGAASVAAWAASKVVVKPEPRERKKALHFSEIAVLADNTLAEASSAGALQAFSQAADLGVHGFAVKIQLTKDEEILIVSDESPSLRGQVADYTLAELKSGQSVIPTESDSADELDVSSILSLRRLLEEFPQLLLIISMADSPDTYEGSLIPSKLWRLLKEMNAADRVVVTSPYDEQIDRFNLYAQNSVALGAGSEEIKKAYVAYTSKFGHLYKPQADLFQLPAKLGVFPLASEGFVHFLQQLNITVFYEADGPADLQKLKRFEAEGFVSEKPAQVLDYLNEN